MEIEECAGLSPPVPLRRCRSSRAPLAPPRPCGRPRACAERAGRGGRAAAVTARRVRGAGDGARSRLLKTPLPEPPLLTRGHVQRGRGQPSLLPPLAEPQPWTSRAWRWAAGGRRALPQGRWGGSGCGFPSAPARVTGAPRRVPVPCVRGGKKAERCRTVAARALGTACGAAGLGSGGQAGSRWGGGRKWAGGAPQVPVPEVDGSGDGWMHGWMESWRRRLGTGKVQKRLWPGSSNTCWGLCHSQAGGKNVKDRLRLPPVKAYGAFQWLAAVKEDVNVWKILWYP